jgi:hypothetical protein
MIADTMRKAAGLVRGRHTTNTFMTGDGKLCIEGALRLAVLADVRGVDTSNLAVVNEVNCMIDTSMWTSNVLPALYALDAVLPQDVVSFLPVRDDDEDKAPITSEDERVMTRVWVYNDQVCTGGEDAAQLLEKAAAHIEEQA